jgi:hypothetical protein
VIDRNIDIVGGLPCAFGPTPHWRVIPFDNNLAQRNVAPVAGGGGATGLLASFVGRRFWANNPYDRTVRVELDAELPALLTRRGWQVRWTSGGPAFTLGPRASKEIRFALDRGEEFTPDDVRAAGGNVTIKVRTRVDGSVVGGMSYALDPTLKRPPRGRPDGKRRRLDEIGEELLRSVDLRGREVKSVDVTHIIVDIALGESYEDENDEA